MNTLDWNKLRAFVEERNPKEVSAGLIEDWYWTATTVYEDGEWKDDGRAYCTSTWATPGFKAEMPNGDVIEVVASRPQTEEDEAQHKIRSDKVKADLARAVGEIMASKSTMAEDIVRHKRS